MKNLVAEDRGRYWAIVRPDGSVAGHGATEAKAWQHAGSDKFAESAFVTIGSGDDVEVYTKQTWHNLLRFNELLHIEYLYAKPYNGNIGHNDREAILASDIEILKKSKYNKWKIRVS